MSGEVSLEVLVTPADRRAALERDVRVGLGAGDKVLPPVWFYDETGSRLFDEITRLPEYYPTRTEAGILRAHAADMVAASGADVLVELGSGTSEKTRLLLDAMAAAGSLRQVVLLDISEEVLVEGAAALRERYGVDVHAVVGDFRLHLEALAKGERRLWAFLGSTIGNFRPDERRRLLGELAGAMADDDHLLLGTDLVKEPERLVAAYDDERGVTAAFNRNVLAVLNRELGGDLVPERFVHRAVWDPGAEWIEMRLRSTTRQVARLDRLGLQVAFEEGEEILTETSAKFRPAGVVAELATAGLREEVAWSDPDGDFRLGLSRRGSHAA